jgi:dihydroorotate dehydrogenase electron transfer subunit
MQEGSARACAAGVFRVVANSPLAARDHYELSIEAPEIAKAAQPGQFVVLRLPGDGGARLRRPFSVAGAGGGVLRIAFKSVGRVTGEMIALKAGDSVDIVGPLGTGFPLEEPDRPRILAGGGYGVAPLVFLAERLVTTSPRARVKLVVGAREAGSIMYLDRLKAERRFEAVLCTDDGSEGEKCTAAALAIRKATEEAGRPLVCACGPLAMLKALRPLFAKAECHVSVDAYMACGTGVCMGCVLPAPGGGYIRACREGPVLPSSAIDWDRLGDGA